MWCANSATEEGFELAVLLNSANGQAITRGFDA
jgi:hypothetical protein